MYVMRPEIRDNLAQRVEELYEESGYNSSTELVNDAVRRRVEELEALHQT